MTPKRTIEIFKEAGYRITDETAVRLTVYAKRIDEFKDVRLTSLRHEEEIMEKLILDSATCMEASILNGCEKTIDIGTGAGLPGIVLKILNPKLKLWLLEANAKKCGFLELIINELGLKETFCLCSRAESLGRDLHYRDFFDVSIARAVGKLSVTLEYAMPLLRTGGVHIAQIGELEKNELKRIENVAEQLGGKLKRRIRVRLPDIVDKSLLIFEKVHQTPMKYPRRPGIPGKRPISG